MSGDEDYETIKAVFESYAYLTELVEDKRTTIARLRKLLFGASTEKTRDVIKGEDETASSESAAAEDSDGPAEKADQENDSEQEQATQRKGHGRNGADAYRGAEKIRVPH